MSTGNKSFATVRILSFAIVTILMTGGFTAQGYGQAKVQPLNCENHHYYFNDGPGTYVLTLQSFQKGNKWNATLCVEGPSHQCKEILVSNKQVWPTQTDWIVNVSGNENSLQIWQREYPGASGDSYGDSPDGPVSAAIFTSTHDFRVTILAQKLTASTFK